MRIGMYESFITAYCFSSEAKRIWSDTATLQGWLNVEVALAKAQAELGMIPASAAEVIESKADAAFCAGSSRSPPLASSLELQSIPLCHR